MSTSTYPAPTSPLYHTSISFLKAMNEKDYEAIGSHIDPSFRYRIHPACVRPENMAKEGVDRGKFLHQGKEWAEKICERLGLKLDQPMNVVEGKDCVVLHLDSDGKLKNGNPLAIEYVFIIRFNTETHKVVALDEIMDSFGMMTAYGIKPEMQKDGNLNFEKKI